MNFDVLIYDLLPILDIKTLKSFACANKKFAQIINKELFWEKLWDRDFVNDESYNIFTHAQKMENRRTWKKLYRRFYLMRKYQINDQGPDFYWKGKYTFGYSWFRGTYVSLTESGGTIVHINSDRIHVMYTPKDLKDYFFHTNGTYFWCDSLKKLIKSLEKHKQSTNFNILSSGDDYDESNYNDAENDIYLIKDKMNIIRELKNILKVAKFLGYRFKLAE